MIYQKRNSDTQPNKKSMKILEKLYNLEKFRELEIEIKKLIKKYPKIAVLFNILGLTLQKQGHLNAAILNFKQAILINPNFAFAYNNLGNVFKDLGRFEEALSEYHKSIKINPNYADPYYNQGSLYKNAYRYDESIESLKKALKIKPDLMEACIDLGVVLTNTGKCDDATNAYQRAIKIKPDYAYAYSNLLFNLNYKTDFDFDLYLSTAKKFRKNCLTQEKLFFKYRFNTKPKKIKLGLVSADFGEHPGGFFTLSTLRELIKKDFELIAYSNLDRQDRYAHHFKSLFSKWRSIEKQKNNEVIKQIVKDGIHILIDAQGHSAHNRLPIFIYKPAPIQVSWLGQGSTGIPEIDYFIGSSHLTPKEEEKYYVEKIWRLPEISQCFTAPDYDLKINNLPAIKNNFITFGCINKLSKVNDQVIALWSKILLAVPNSKLLLKSRELSNQKITNEILKKFNKYNIGKNHLILKGKSKTRKEVLEVYNEIDIALDPFPFQGNTSTIEAVWMGVPVVVLKGDRYLFHFGESINTNLKMHDWIAENRDEYVSKTIKFSSNIDQLSKLRANLRKIALESPIFDAPRFVEHFSNALWNMWKKFQNQK